MDTPNYTPRELLGALKRGDRLDVDRLPSWFHDYRELEPTHEEFQIRKRVAEALRKDGYDIRFSQDVRRAS